MNRGFGEERQSAFDASGASQSSATPSATERLMISAADPLHVKLKLGPGGRVVIPVEVRAAMELKEGDTLLGEFDGESLKLSAFNHMVREIQKEMSALVPRSTSVVDELIAERRAAAAREEED